MRERSLAGRLGECLGVGHGIGSDLGVVLPPPLTPPFSPFSPFPLPPARPAHEKPQQTRQQVMKTRTVALCAAAVAASCVPALALDGPSRPKPGLKTQTPGDENALPCASASCVCLSVCMQGYASMSVLAELRGHARSSSSSSLFTLNR